MVDQSAAEQVKNRTEIIHINTKNMEETTQSQTVKATSNSRWVKGQRTKVCSQRRFKNTNRASRLM